MAAALGEEGANQRERRRGALRAPRQAPAVQPYNPAAAAAKLANLRCAAQIIGQNQYQQLIVDTLFLGGPPTCARAATSSRRALRHCSYVAQYGKRRAYS
jgi:hypothetical protein